MSSELASDNAKRIRNFVVVVVASVLAIALTLGLQNRSPAASLSEMAEAATPLDVALANDKPTLIEFYANWCTSCQAMAPDVAQLKSEYGGKVNFVMLNVDNTKWLPEMLNYRVDGIPHFEFISVDSQEKGAVIGEAPRTILAENLDALIKKRPLPHAQEIGRISEVEAVDNPVQSQSTDPRSHGTQAVR